MNCYSKGCEKMVCFEAKECKPEPCCNGDCNQGRTCPNHKPVVINVEFKEVKRSLFNRIPWIVKAAALAALWFVFVYVPKLGL